MAKQGKNKRDDQAQYQSGKKMLPVREAMPSKLKKALKLGKRHHLKEEWDLAAKYYLEAWDYAPDDLNLLSVLAFVLCQLGVRDKAIAVLERALAIHGPDENLCKIMGKMATDMEMFSIAEKLWRHAISFNPNDPSHYVNLASALNKQEKFDESIDILQAALAQFPEHADLWNVLGNAVRLRDGPPAAIVFFQEALRLEPTNYKVLNNIAMCSPIDDRIQYVRRAIEIFPEEPEPHVGLSFDLMLKGQLEDAFKEYEWRLSPNRAQNQTQRYGVDAPRWTGQSLEGKRLIIHSEQGIGDELLFAQLLKNVANLGTDVILGCDPRLVSVYQRSYPSFRVVGHKDVVTHGNRVRYYPDIHEQVSKGEITVDYSIPVGSLPSLYWKSLRDIRKPPEGYLVPDADLAAKFGQEIKTIASGRRPVGVCWKSGFVTAERKGFMSIDKLAEIGKMEDVALFSLQYANAEDDIAAFEQEYGIKVHQFDGVDLRNDIEANLAIMSQMDSVIGPATAPLVMAMSIGCKAFLINAGAPWWVYNLNKKRVPHARYAHLIKGSDFNNDWSQIMGYIKERLPIPKEELVF